MINVISHSHWMPACLPLHDLTLSTWQKKIEIETSPSIEISCTIQYAVNIRVHKKEEGKKHMPGVFVCSRPLFNFSIQKMVNKTMSCLSIEMMSYEHIKHILFSEKKNV